LLFQEEHILRFREEDVDGIDLIDLHKNSTFLRSEMKLTIGLSSKLSLAIDDERNEI